MKIPEIFVNYVDSRTRASPINLAGARIVLGVYILWRGASIQVRSLTEWPVHYMPYLSFLLPPDGFEWVFVLEQYLLVIASLLFIIGYRTRLNAFIVGTVFSHLTGVNRIMNLGGETDQMVIGALSVFLFGLYCEQDELSIDGIRRTGRVPLETLNERLQDPDEQRFRMTALALILVSLGIFYASSIVGRFFNPGWIAWASPENFARFILIDGPRVGLPRLEFLVNTPSILVFFAVLTLVLEAGLLVAAIAGLPITPVIFGLIGMHAGIVPTMGIFFLDMYFFLLLFLSFDTIHTRLSATREIDVLYHGDCYFCARSLYPFKILDTQDSLNFYTQYTAPDTYLDDERVDLEARMYVFVDGELSGGYYAFQQLFRQFPATRILARIMSISPIAAIGERVYRYIAANRTRHFRCSYQPGDGAQED